MTSIYPLTDQADSYLEELAESLSVTDTAREAAERSYTSLGNWLCRDQSSVKVFDPKVYVQGSHADASDCWRRHKFIEPRKAAIRVRGLRIRKT